jgi:alpha-beta hydrolase superfamily lysophospholipase
MAALAAAAVALNVLACQHARAMTQWADHGSRTPSPEDLGWARRAQVLLTGVRLPRPVHSMTPGDEGLTFQVHRFPGSQDAMLEAWHIPGDSGRPRILFLLFHGYGAAKDTLLPVARALHELGHDVLMVDFHGSGGSSGTDTTLGVREALDVQASAGWSRARWPERPIVLYGQSMGGAAVLRAIARHGADADGLVAEATFDRLLTTVKHRFHAMGLPATPFAHLLVFWGGLTSGTDGFDLNPVEDAEAIHHPTLVLHGGRDLRVRRREAEAVHQRLRGWKRYAEFGQAGHGLVLLSDRARWESEIRLLSERVLAERGAPASAAQGITPQAMRAPPPPSFSGASE